MNFAWTLRSRLSALLPASAPMPNAFDAAMQAYSDLHFREAFDGLARLADAGDGDAARIALLMVEQGPRLLGECFHITPQQRRRWLDAASATEQQRLTALH